MTGLSAMPRRDLLLLLLGCLVVAYAVYANTFANTWTYDDTPVILQNPDLQSFANFFADSYPGRPLRELSLMLDRAIFGMEPAGWHIQHIFWHALNGFLVGALAVRLGGGMAAAVIAALFFLAHPLQVEVVAQLSHRKDNLALAMALLGVHAWFSAVAAASLRQRLVLAALAATLFVLGGLAKESVVVLPLMLVVWEWLFIDRDRRLLGRWPQLLLASAVCAVLAGLFWYLFQNGRSQLLTSAGYQLFKYNHFTPVTEWSYLPILLKSWLFMLGKVVWPFDLALEYVYPFPAGWLDPWVLGMLLLLGLSGWGAIVAWKQSPPVCFALLWIVLFWLPVANLWPTSAYFAADRYLYAPMAGVALLAGFGVAAAARRWTKPVLSLTIILLGILSVLTWQQNRVWKDQFSLWQQAARVSPQSSVALNNFGVQLFKVGQPGKGLELIERAAQNPYYYEANLNAMSIYQRKGNREKADFYRQRANDPHAGNKFISW